MYVIRAPCVFCVYMGFGFSPDSVFRSALCSGGFCLMCTSTLSLSLPRLFFPFFPLLYCSTNSWSFSCGIEGAGSEEGSGSALVFFLLFFSPALNRFFSGVIERYVRVLSLSLSLSLCLCSRCRLSSSLSVLSSLLFIARITGWLRNQFHASTLLTRRNTERLLERI